MRNTATVAESLSPMQERTLTALRRGDAPVVFDPEFIAELRADFEEAIGELGSRLGGEQLFVSKHRIGAVLGCEARFVGDDDFSWSTANARGQVAHRAIQLWLNWRGEPTPADVVDDAIARVADDDRSLGTWVAALSDGDLADLRAAAVATVVKFVECFPPLDRRWLPVTETGVRWPVDGPIVLSGKYDLIIGRPNGAESTRVIIDLKTGRVAPVHRDDLRFYALLETMRSMVPPRKVASFYLDAGEAITEDVGPATLQTAARRTLDAIHRMIELTVEDATPVKRTGPVCRWCALAAGCEQGQAYLADTD